MVGENATNGLGRDATDYAFFDELTGQFRAIPLGEGSSREFGSLAGHLHQM
jgi:hypothetical protein